MRHFENNLASSEEQRNVSDIIKGKLGRTAVRLTTVLSGAAVILGVGSTIEISQDRDAKAEAYSGYYMNEAESDWCGWPSRWALRTRAFELSSTADREADQVASDTGWSDGNGGADAVRHCRWNALMAHEFGRETASGFAWRHEYDDEQPADQKEMDLHNNLKGRDWAEDVNSLQRCIDGVNNSELIRLEN